MKRFKKIALFIAVLFTVLIAAHIIYLNTLSAKERYPADTYLDQEPNKTALIIVAHDDDMIGSAGTIAALVKKGWSIREMCFYQQGGRYLLKDSLKNPIRKRDLQRVAAIQGLKGVDPIDFNFRRDMQTEASYMPMPYTQFAVNYYVDSMRQIIADYLKKYRPSVIFTLDDVMGGYGHPDHVFVSQVVRDHCNANAADPAFSVKRIYQPVFAPSLAESVLAKMPVYNEAKKVYNSTGMPAPTVQFDISAYASLKKEGMQAYTTEQNSLKKIWPWYNWYPASVYFKIFDREFYRVVTIRE